MRRLVGQAGSQLIRHQARAAVLTGLLARVAVAVATAAATAGTSHGENTSCRGQQAEHYYARGHCRASAHAPSGLAPPIAAPEVAANIAPELEDHVMRLHAQKYLVGTVRAGTCEQLTYNCDKK